MTCPSCRSDNPPGSGRCHSCGESLTELLAPGSVVAARWDISKMLGRGGMGIVYRARDRLLDEDVALKILAPELRRSPSSSRRFRSEIKLARRVSHWNVCRIHEYGEADGLSFISMELVPGDTLKRIVTAGGGLPWERAFDCAIQMTEGLEAIHRAGIIHRDLKTANVMRDESGRVRLMDFGIAKSVAPGTPHWTTPGHPIGTPEYMSPEQVRGENVTFASDIYAFGVVVFELFTGEVPFRGDTPVATALKHLHEIPPLTGERANGLPPAIVPILSRALAKQPAERYPGVTAMRDALVEARSGSSSEPTPVQSGRDEATTIQPMERPFRARTDPTMPDVSMVGTRPRAGPRVAVGLTIVAALLAAAAVFELTRPGPDRASSGRTVPSSTSIVSSTQAISPAPMSASPAAARVQSTRPKAPSGSAARDHNRRPAQSAEPAPAAAELSVVEIDIPIGTAMSVRIDSELRSDRSRAGQEFVASLAEPLILNGHEVASARSPLKGRLETVGSLGGSPSRPYMELSLTELVVQGRPLPIRTAYYRLVAPSSQSADIRAIVIGVLAGAGVGAAIDGGGGIVPGAAAGGAIGAAISTKPATQYHFGNRLTFKLAEPLTIRMSAVLR